MSFGFGNNITALRFAGGGGASPEEPLVGTLLHMADFATNDARVYDYTATGSSRGRSVRRDGGGSSGQVGTSSVAASVTLTTPNLGNQEVMATGVNILPPIEPLGASSLLQLLDAGAIVFGVQIEVDRSLTITQGPEATPVASSAAGLVVVGEYQHIELSAQLTSDGFVQVKREGVVVAQATGDFSALVMNQALLSISSNLTVTGTVPCWCGDWYTATTSLVSATHPYVVVESHPFASQVAVDGLATPDLTGVGPLWDNTSSTSNTDSLYYPLDVAYGSELEFGAFGEADYLAVVTRAVASMDSNPGADRTFTLVSNGVEQAVTVLNINAHALFVYASVDLAEAESAADLAGYTTTLTTSTAGAARLHKAGMSALRRVAAD